LKEASFEENGKTSWGSCVELLGEHVRRLINEYSIAFWEM